MRWHRWLLVGTSAALLAGCGDRRLVVTVDVLSYLDPALTNVEFGPVPPVPGGLYTGEQDVLKDIVVNLVDGTGSVADIHSVTIAMSVIAFDSTGSGTDTLRLYISDPEFDPLTTPPAVVIPVTLTPGVTDTIATQFDTDARVAELFSGKRLRLTLTTALRGPDSGDPLNGRVQVNALDAILIAGRRLDL